MMNRYRKMLPKKLYNIWIALSDGQCNEHYVDTVPQLAEFVQTHPNHIVDTGIINGENIIRYCRRIGHTENLTVKQFYDILPLWLKDNFLVPELYVTGGYYPTKDGTLKFALQRYDYTKNDFYIYTKRPWTTDMPIYRINNTKLVRVKKGRIPSPHSHIIDKQLDEIICRKIKNLDLI